MHFFYTIKFSPSREATTLYKSTFSFQDGNVSCEFEPMHVNTYVKILISTITWLEVLQI